MYMFWNEREDYSHTMPWNERFKGKSDLPCFRTWTCGAFKWFPWMLLDSKGETRGYVLGIGFIREEEVWGSSYWIRRVTRCMDVSDSKCLSVWILGFDFSSVWWTWDFFVVFENNFLQIRSSGSKVLLSFAKDSSIYIEIMNMSSTASLAKNYKNNG